MQDAIGVRADRRREEGIASLRRPGRWVVRELEEGPTADPGRDMEVGEQPQSVGPRVWGEPPPPRQRQLRHRSVPQHPTGERDIGLVDVEGVRLAIRLTAPRRAAEIGWDSRVLDVKELIGSPSD